MKKGFLKIVQFSMRIDGLSYSNLATQKSSLKVSIINCMQMARLFKSKKINIFSPINYNRYSIYSCFIDILLIFLEIFYFNLFFH